MAKRRWERPEATTRAEARDCFSEWFRFGFVHGRWADYLRRGVIGLLSSAAIWQAIMSYLTTKVEVVDDPYSDSGFNLFHSEAHAGEQRADTVKGITLTPVRIKGKTFISVVHDETGNQTWVEFPFDDFVKQSWARKK